MVRLPGYAERKPAELSGGQRQRVALARAIVNRPRVLLLDEPLGALDLKLREQMQVELKTIQGEVGITFVYVTHDQDEALTMSDRIAVFNEGRIEQVEPALRALRAAAERVRRRLRRRLQPARTRRRSASRSARRRCSCSSRATPERPAHRAGPGRRRRLRGDDDAVHGGLDAGRRTSAGSSEHRGARRMTRVLSGGRRSWWAGARSTRSPSESRSNKRGGITVRKNTPGPNGLARRRRPAGDSCCCSPAAVGDDDDGTSGAEALQKVGKGEGQVNLISWAGYVEPAVVEAVRTEDRLQGQQQGGRHLRRNGAADAHRAVRRGLGLGQRHRRAWSRAVTSTRSTSTSSPTTRRSSTTSRTSPTTRSTASHYGIPHGRGANLLMWNDDDVKPAPDLLGRDPRPETGGQVQGQDQRLRRPDLHRGRGRLPEGPRARPGDRQPLRAQRRAVRRGGRPAEGTAAQRRRILVRR